MGHGKRGHDRYKRTESPEWNHQTEQKQQVVRTVEDVEKSEIDKPQRRLMPSRIEPDESGVGRELEGPDRRIRREKSENGDDMHAQPTERRVDRKSRTVRLNRILEQDVEHGLVPIHGR